MRSVGNEVSSPAKPTLGAPQTVFVYPVRYPHQEIESDGVVSMVRQKICLTGFTMAEEDFAPVTNTIGNASSFFMLPGVNEIGKVPRNVNSRSTAGPIWPSRLSLKI